MPPRWALGPYAQEPMNWIARAGASRGAALLLLLLLAAAAVAEGAAVTAGLGHNKTTCVAPSGDDSDEDVPEWKGNDTWNEMCEICDAEEGDAEGDETLWYCRCCNIVVCKDGDGCMEKLDAEHPDTGGYSICTPPGEEEECYICPACFDAHNDDFVVESDDDE